MPSAVRPATGSVDAVSNETSSGIGARWPERTATRSAQPPPFTHATTRVPAGGLEPSGAGSAITPATSHPGRHPSSAVSNAVHSPRFSELARTSTTATPSAGDGILHLAQLDAAGRARGGHQRPHQVTIWWAIEKPRCCWSSAWIRCTTALISARCVNACGKFPRWRPVVASISSA